MDRIDSWLHAGLRASVYLIGAALLTFLLGKLFIRMRKLSAELIQERGGPNELDRSSWGLLVLASSDA